MRCTNNTLIFGKNGINGARGPDSGERMSASVAGSNDSYAYGQMTTTSTSTIAIGGAAD